jgi:hypothetical protein
MDSSNQKNAMALWLPEAVVVIMSLIALQKGNPYAYYIFLRWVVCPAVGWIAWKAYNRSFSIFLVISAGVLALLFNPLLRVSLDRSRWEILNIALVIVAIWSAAVSLKLAGSKKDLPLDQ